MEVSKFNMLAEMAGKKDAPIPEVGMSLWVFVKLFYVYFLFTGWQLPLATYHNLLLSQTQVKAAHSDVIP